MKKISLFETMADIFGPDFLLVRANYKDSIKPKSSDNSTPEDCQFTFVHNPDSDPR